MAKRTSIEDELTALAAIAKDPARADAREKLTSGLRSRVSFVVAKAADVVAKLGWKDFLAELIAAFDRFLNDSKLSDKGCSAKTAIAKALYEFGDAQAEPVFLAGVEHFQMEGSFGPPVDVATDLRGHCALGLVRIAHRHVMLHLVNLLNDPWPQARAFAARALAYSERDEGALLLRFKLLIGDAEIDVINECMTALTRFRQPDLAKFLSRFLENGDPGIRTSAALSLGETRQADALDALRDHFPRERDDEVRRAILLGAATLRLPQAIDWLIHLIESGNVADASGSIEAISLYKRDPAIAERVQRAVNERKESEIQKAMSRYMPKDQL